MNIHSWEVYLSTHANICLFVWVFFMHEAVKANLCLHPWIIHSHTGICHHMLVVLKFPKVQHWNNCEWLILSIGDACVCVCVLFTGVAAVCGSLLLADEFLNPYFILYSMCFWIFWLFFLPRWVWLNVPPVRFLLFVFHVWLFLVCLICPFHHIWI